MCLFVFLVMGLSHVPDGCVCGNSGDIGSSWGQSWPLDPRAYLTALAGKERAPLTLLAEGLRQTGGACSGWLVAMVRDQGKLLTMTGCTVKCGTSGKFLVSRLPHALYIYSVVPHRLWCGRPCYCRRTGGRPQCCPAS